MALLIRRQKSKAILFISVLFLVVVVYAVIQNQYQLRNALSYATRPLWDTKDGPTQVIPHFYGEGMKMDAETCKLHGWTERKGKDNLKVLDAVLMSNELDLMEIRMNELDSVVDFFLIIESNATFTGLPKDTFFLNNRGRFAKFEKKIVYQLRPGFPLQPGQSAWDVERGTRIAMSDLIQSQIATFPTNSRNLVIMSDLDELPSHHTIELLKTCDFGETLHLQLPMSGISVLRAGAQAFICGATVAFTAIPSIPSTPSQTLVGIVVTASGPLLSMPSR
ncbi:unnamed protein product [Cyclocybe aegerita]|uniref:Glycosyltransferase family 17 protein n=1 Tax=Cyclocybe aegerita TaxID=1973307 RepID=A0A8S0WJT2_CYCAE|nr:unnamed protein product [Cyclocybe aegerita]